MAENILQTRIQLRYDTYTRWMNSNVILKPGETAIAYFPQQQRIEDLSNAEPENTPPAVGLKVGDGIRYFRELPWVQAISADVYNWAKSPYKPTYTAQEIQGLQSFIENMGGGSGGGASVSRIYQLYEGSDDNANKYFLRYLDENGNWVIDTSTAVDLTSLANLISWINPVIINEYPSMTARMNEQVQVLLGRLDVTDIARENQFVTAVAEEDGKVQVSRARPTFSNIAGTATVAQGGTGRTSFPENTVLVGNENEGLLYRSIAEEIDTSNNLVPSGLIKAYVDNATAGLEGAMHFIGEANVAPIGGANPQIAEYNFANAQPGDVVLWEQKEYVWTGGNWRLLGDEGSYAIKGSIKDADIDADANIAQSKIANLTETFDTKVDKEQGKGLSSNDYTTEEKLKLRDIEDGAEVNVIEHILLNGTEVPPREVNNADKTVELNIKEFDDESRHKLGTIEEGAQVNSINGITLNGTAQIPDNNKIVALTIKEFTDEYKLKVDGIEPGAQVNAIQTIYLNGTQIFPDQNKRIDLSIRQYPQADAELLQEHDNKLKTIENGAQVNIIEHIKIDNQEITPDQNKTVSIITDPHTEHINKIESISINGTVYPPDSEKQVNITLDQAALNLNVLEGAQIPPLSGNVKEEVGIIQKKLQLARIAVTANVSDLTQTANTYIILDCGTSDSDIHT